MKALVGNLKGKDEAFNKVQFTKEGVTYTKEQLATKVAGCKPAEVAGAAEFLRWLVQVLINVRSCFVFVWCKV